MLAHCLALIDAAGPACVAVKPQLACFERLGFAGWLALEAVVATRARAGLLVLADGKRGDVPVTAAAYAQALDRATPTPFGAAPGLRPTRSPPTRCSAATRSRRSSTARARPAPATFVLVRTSNPGAADVFDLPLATGEPLWERLARAGRRARRARRARAQPSRRRDRRDRARAPRADARADARRAVPAAGSRRAGRRRRRARSRVRPGRAAGLVTASRSIAQAHESAGGDPPTAARAEAERLREAAWALA